ncbi:MAG: hypothetical protein WBM78_09660 [Desulfobacterales bacterium]
MQSIPFSKMSVNGNNFVILDETQQPVLSEPQKSEFAYFATETNFGVGCDNMLVVQTCTDDTFMEINTHRRYWKQMPESSSAEYIFRMFEPNGEEALSCGNGLKCIARYLFYRYGIEQARIMTELPLEQSRVVTIGTDSKSQMSWANMGFPRRVPGSHYCPQTHQSLDEPIDWIAGIQVKFRENDLAPYTIDNQLTLSGYLVFTGEPHLVVLDSGLSDPAVSRTLFTETINRTNKNENTDKRVNFGSSLIQLIGSYVNKNCRHLFPAGININFAHYSPQQQRVEYRCFERGIEKETLACGTGALAVAFVMRWLKMINDRVITVLPHCCRYYHPDAELVVEERPDGWVLSSQPKYLFAGDYHFNSAYDQPGKEAFFDQSKHFAGIAESTKPGVTTPISQYQI